MFNVAFAYTEKAGGYEGVITWTSFPSEEKFNEWYTDARKEKQRVVEKGVSQERCIELVRQTPRACRIAAALEESRRADGTADPAILSMELGNVLFAEA